MLIKCPECELQVSDKAIICPHCGYPLQPNAKRKIRSKNGKHKRLPNGFGQISEIKNRNLRNPFRAMITVGKTPEGKPICKLLKPVSYFPTYNDAYSALVAYNKNPYDLDSSITLKELYERWSQEYYSKKAESTTKNFKCAWNYCSSIQNMNVRDIRIRHIKGLLENGTALKNGVERIPSTYTKKRIKILLNLLFDYAVDYEIVDKNYARAMSFHPEIENEQQTQKQAHIAFSDEELKILWENLGKNEYIDIILIQCYSGWRPQELGLLELDKIDLERGSFQGGMKTSAGENRIVPIHSKIFPLVEKRYYEAKQLGSKYLFNYTVNGSADYYLLTYDRYRHIFTKIINDFHLNRAHRPHDGRKEFVTLAKKYNVDEYAIKYMVGHAINDLTEHIYTEREFDWLKQEIEKIKIV